MRFPWCVLIASVLLFGCDRTVNEYHIHECGDGAGGTGQLEAENRRLAMELEYERFRLRECLGAAAAEVRTALPPVSRTCVAASHTTGGETNAMVEEADHAEGITWTYDGSVPRDLGQTAFYLYMGRKATGASWLRLRSQYAGEHWLHIRGIRVTAGELVFERRTDPAMVFAQADGALVTEWSDVQPSKVDLQVIARILASPDARLTFLGHRGEHSRSITDVEREAFQRVLQEYEALAVKG